MAVRSGALALLFVCVTALPIFPQAAPSPPTAHRPKIGLALEGGGALGLAHVGLIRWFEENHIPIDYIAGASMGGLVGGFYASGMNGVEMRDLVGGLDWNRLVNGQLDYQKLSFRRKEDYRAYGNNTVLGLKHNLVLPSGLNSGQGLDLLLSKVALPYSQMKSFDDLPTPFRCVSTNLVTAQEKVFDNGSLAAAMRATMSIPGLFEPVYQGDAVYVDGGILNNMPVDLVKGMGADIVIAVYLAADAFDPKKPQSAVGILGRTLSAVVAANEHHNIEMADLLVSINLANYGTTDFNKYKDIEQRGYDGAQKRAGVLSRFAIDDKAWAAYLQERASKRKIDVPPPQYIAIQGVDGQLAEQVRSYFTPLIDKPFSNDAVSAQIEKIMGNNVFSYMAYYLEEKDGKHGLGVYVHPAASRPPTLQPAILLDGSDYRNTRFALGARLTLLDFGGFRSELRTDLLFGSTYGIRSEYFHPIEPLSRWFIAPNAFANTRPLDFYHRSRLDAMYRIREAGGGVDMGYSFGNTSELRFGYQTSQLISTIRIGDESLYPVTRGRFGATRLSYVLDRVDDEIVPHSGILARANMRLIDANPGTHERLPALDLTSNYFLPLSRKSTVFATAEGATVFSQSNGGIPLYYLGGPQRLSAYGNNELFGNQYVYGRLGYMRQINTLTPFTDGRIYLVADYEVGKMYGFADSTRLPMDVNAGVLVRTVFGPLFLGASAGDSGHRKWYFQLGRFFKAVHIDER